jgi:hypothetical protein
LDGFATIVEQRADRPSFCLSGDHQRIDDNRQIICYSINIRNASDGRIPLDISSSPSWAGGKPIEQQ